jgi:uncharacterized membrane protein
MRRLTIKALILLLAFSTVGLMASLMTIIFFLEMKLQPPLCIGGQLGAIQINCEKVLSSPYSSIFGIPLEVLAAAWFSVTITLVILFYFGYQRLLKFLFFWRFIGVPLVPYLMYIEFSILHALCIYCTIMHAMIIVDFIVVSLLLFSSRFKSWAYH